MPNYRVVSGEYNMTIRRLSPQQAAEDAIGKLREGNFISMRLGMMTVVTLDDKSDEDDPFYISTLNLVRKHGLNYRETT